MRKFDTKVQHLKYKVLRVTTASAVTSPAVVTKEGFNTLASFQNALQFGDKEVKCGDQNNKDLYGKSLLGKALCLPQTIGSTTGRGYRNHLICAEGFAVHHQGLHNLGLNFTLCAVQNGLLFVG